MKTTNLTDQELEQIKDLQKKHQAIIQELGNIELLRLELDERRNNAEAVLKQVREEERNLAQWIEAMYGEGVVNLDQGNFIPAY